MDVRAAIAEYAHAKLQLSRETRHGHKTRLSLFAEFCEARSLTLETITAAHIRAFLDEVSQRRGMKTEQVKRSTVRTYAMTIKAFMAWCAREDFEDLVSPKVAQRVKLPPADSEVIETFTPEQIAALFAACEKQPFPVRDKALLCVLLDTGARAGEVVGLTLDCVWLDADDSYIKVTGKGRKEREIALGRTARIALRRYITRYRKSINPRERHVFMGYSGKPLTTSGLGQIIADLGERAHIKGVRCSPHAISRNYRTFLNVCIHDRKNGISRCESLISPVSASACLDSWLPMHTPRLLETDHLFRR